MMDKRNALPSAGVDIMASLVWDIVAAIPQITAQSLRRHEEAPVLEVAGHFGCDDNVMSCLMYSHFNFNQIFTRGHKMC